jgi:NAD(P)-dependent dehydrogenase (short-subunit alcohol dehydrogenase family)
MQVEQQHPQHIHKHDELGCCDQKYPGQEKLMEPKPDHGEKSYKGLGRLKNKVAIVTGGDSGIGKAVCIAFAREGADIVCSYLNEEEDANDTKKWVEQAGKKCVLIPGDISKDEHCKKIIDTALKEFSHIDLLINNAAFQRPAVKSITDMDYDSILYTFKTNIIAMFSLSKYAIPHLREGGSIINTSSIKSAVPGGEGILDYSTTKAAIVAFTKGLCGELIDKGIRVNCVAPGPVWTPLIQVSFDKEKQKQFGMKSPYKRPAQPVEIAGAFVFLASNESTYVNGEVIAVTGNM